MEDVDPIILLDSDQRRVVLTDEDYCLVMQCLVNISEKHYYGTSILLNVLRGSQSEKIKERKLDLTPEYGKLKSIKREDLECIVEWLVDNHFILKTKGQYPVLHITPEGLKLENNLSPQKLTALRKYLEKQNTH